MAKGVTEIASENGRNYITPEDVRAAMESGVPMADVRYEVMSVIGKRAVGGKWFGAEDASLCAFVASARRK